MLFYWHYFIINAVHCTTDVSPWPWPWPRPRICRSRHAVMLYTILVFTLWGWNLCLLNTCWENYGCSCQLSPCWEGLFWSSALIVRKCQTSCSSHWCLPSVPSSADCCDGQCACRDLANSVITVIFWVFGILLCQLSYPLIHKLTKCS